MEITRREENNVIIFVLNGRADSAGALELDKALQHAISQGNHKMVLDMTGVQYINSAALRTLADVVTHNREHNGDLRLVALNPKVARVFKIIGFDKFFETYVDISAAIAGF